MNASPLPVLVFAGSTRAQSHNRKLARVAADMARAAGAQVTLLELADHELPLYNADLEARGTPAPARRLKEIFHAHPAWIVCSARAGRSSQMQAAEAAAGIRTSNASTQATRRPPRFRCHVVVLTMAAL